MFKKLKDKLAEEVKSSPQRIQQFAQAAQAAVTSASSSISDITNNDLFSIGDNDNSQNTTPKPQSSPQQPANVFQSVSLQSPSELVDYTNEMDNQRQRRLSNSSFASDVSFRLPSYETPSMYHLQSDMEVSASEADERGFSGGPATLERVTKEQLYSAYKRTQERYTKYRNQYGDLARHYKLLERENAKARSVLVETQDKALRRISELKEQCSLEQSAKAHLEKALRIEIEEKAMKIEALNTKVNLLQNTENSNIAEKNDNDVQLINLASDNTFNPSSDESTQPEITNINNKIQKMEQLLNKYKESLKISKDKNSQMTAEMQILSNDIENKSKQIQEMKSTEEQLTEANKKIKELNDVNEELQNQINSYDFTKIKELSSLEIDLQKANEEIRELRGKIEIFSKKEEEYAFSLAENKLSIHKELESKEAEIKSLKNGLSACTQEVQSLKIVLEDYKNSISLLEEEKAKLNKDCTELTATRTRIDEMNLQLQELSKKCQSLEQLKAKADEEYKCLQLQLKQETAEKLAMIDRNVYLESRNTQLSEENTKKSTHISNLENEMQIMSKNKETVTKDESEVDNLLKKLKMWKEKCKTLESEIQEEREELVKLQTEIEKLLTNHESIQAQNAEFRATIANLSTANFTLEAESEEKQTKIAYSVKKMSQEAKELRQLLSLAANETHSLLKINKESFGSIVNEVINLINNSVQSFEKNIDVTKTSQYSDKVKDNEKLLVELATTCDRNSEILSELTNLREENTNLYSKIKSIEHEKNIINEKLAHTCHQYDVTLEEIKSARKENETLHSKIKETEEENLKIENSSQTLESEKKELNEIIILMEDKYNKLKEEFESVSREYTESVKRINSMSRENQELTKRKETEMEASQKIQAHIETEKAHYLAAVEKLKQLDLDKTNLTEKLSIMEGKNIQLVEQLDELNLLHQNTNIKLRELEAEMVKKSNDLEKYKHNQASLEVEIVQHLQKIEEITTLEKENQYLSENIKVIENKYELISAEFEDLKKLFTTSEENMNKLNADNKHKTEECEKKLAQINDLQEKNKVLSDDDIKLKNDVANFTSNISKLESEIEYIKKSHSDMEFEKDRLNEIIEKLERKVASENITKNTQTELDSDKLDEVLKNNNSMFENKWVLEHKQTAMTNTASLNLKTDAQEDIIEQYATLKINYDALKDDNRRLHSDIEGLQSYLTKISKENSVLNDKLREVIATSEHSMDNDQLSSDINKLKNELELGKEKINDLLRENSLLIEENLELKDQLNSQNYSKPLEIVNTNTHENIKEKYNDLMQASTEMSKRNDDLEQINQSVSGNNKQLQDKNEKLRLSNEKLERRLDEALVSLRHLHSLQENTELEYLRNILYEYLTGPGSHSLTLAKVLAAIVKFDDIQTQLVLQKEKERQGFLRQLGII